MKRLETRRVWTALFWTCLLLSWVPARSQGGSQVIAWGSDQSGESDVPANATNIVAVAAGPTHSLALTEEGYLLAWGAPEIIPPAGVSNLVAIAAGGFHSMGVRADGSLWVWSSQPSVAAVPLAATNVIQMSAGNIHVMVITADRRVLAWGDDYWGACNVPPEATNIVAIAAGGIHSLALRQDGVLLVWGQVTRIPASVTNVIGIGATFDHCLALRQDGTVVEWDNYNDYTTPTGLTNVVGVNNGGANHWVVLRDDGTVAAWSWTPSPGENVPVGLRNASAIAAGGDHSLALVNLPGLRITAPPLDFTALAGDPVLMSSEARGTMPISYSWTKDNVGLPGAVQRFLFLPDVQATDAGLYRVTVANSAGSLTSSPATLSVVETPPRIQLAFTNLALLPGAATSLSAMVRGTEPLGMQWQKDSTDIPNATGPALLLTNLTWSDAGAYALVATNARGQTISTPVLLSIVNAAAWGSITPVETNLPISATNLAALAAGGGHVVALREDGTLLAWGLDGSGQCDIPASVSNAMGIAAGNSFSVALPADGKPVAWGNNSLGQTNVPASASNIIAIAAGQSHALGLRGDGTAVGWGAASAGQVSIPASATNLVSLAAGGSHSLGLRADGSVVAWGLGSSGQTTVPAAATNIVAIAAGNSHSLALRSDGNVLAWGNNSYSQCAVPVAATNIVAIAANGFASVALTQKGQVLAWGDNTYNRTLTPALVTNAIAVAVAGDFNAALVDRGVLRLYDPPTSRITSAGNDLVLLAAASGAPPLSFQWFFNGSAISGATSAWLLLRDAQAAQAGAYSVVVSSGSSFVTSRVASVTVTAVVPSIGLQPVGPQQRTLGGGLNLTATARGTEPMGFQWQFNGFDLPGATNLTLGLTNLGLDAAGSYRLVATNIVGMTVSPEVTLIVPDVLAWGEAQYNKTNVPPSATNVVRISAGRDHTLALRTDGTLLGWGYSSYGITNPPASATNIISISAGMDHDLALRADGTILAWGNSAYGKTNVPISATNIIDVAAGANHSLVCRADGTVVAWGSNYPGVTNVPARAYNVIRVAAPASIVDMGGYSLALRRDGSVVGWGNSSVGLTNPPASVSNSVAVAPGGLHCLALKGDGHVVAWGQDSYRQLDIPAAATNIVAIAAGQYHSLALRNDGSVFAWGQTVYGATVVPTNAFWACDVSAGRSHSAALAYRGQPRFTDTLGSLVAFPGGDFSLNALAVGAAPLTYQWFHNGVLIPGASGATMTISTVGFADSGTYSVMVSNQVGTLTGLVANLSVELPPKGPQITQQPQSQTVLVGTNVLFSVAASGNPPPACQWQFKNSNLLGATNNTYEIDHVVTNDAGNYRVIVSNAVGVVTSQVASLTVNLPPRPVITASASSNGFLLLRIEGLTGLGTTVLFGSTNLEYWEPMATNPSASGTWEFLFPIYSNQPAGFFRAVEENR